MKHFYGSFIVTAIALAASFYFWGFYGLYIIILLAILEISLSFDNAVVNAKVLETMEPIWQKRFITFGIPIAVFGMRFVFPVLIVSIAASMGFVDTFNLALNDPEKYHHTLEGTKNLIYAFGGAFLMMVFLDFFFEEDREHKWIKIIENNKAVNAASKIENIEVIIAIAVGLVLLQVTADASIATAYFGGILLHSLIGSLDALLSTDGIRNGFMGFLYLEILDASFSFDGVIGAFALSSNIFVIMLGLGIGAIFVRSLTIYFVEEKTLNQFRYLEHGAHYAIAALSLIMFIKMFHEVNEVIVGTLGIFFIGISLYHSVQARKREEKQNKG
jgi:uncharacterized protein